MNRQQAMMVRMQAFDRMPRWKRDLINQYGFDLYVYGLQAGISDTQAAMSAWLAKTVAERMAPKLK